MQTTDNCPKILHQHTFYLIGTIFAMRGITCTQNSVTINKPYVVYGALDDIPHDYFHYDIFRPCYKHTENQVKTPGLIELLLNIFDYKIEISGAYLFHGIGTIFSITATVCSYDKIPLERVSFRSIQIYIAYAICKGAMVKSCV